MNVPMSWLKEYVDIDCSISEFVDKITMSGSKVESVNEMAKNIKNVVVGKIIKIEKHPDADKLVVCSVDISSKVLQIITGATNVFEGAIVPVALHGACLAGGLKIKTSKMRGQLSEGMLCSVEELGFTIHDYPESPEDGIYIFKDKVELGADAVQVLMMRDDIVEFEITSNRPDCLSILGIAREAAATFDKPFKYPEIKLKEVADGDINEMIKIKITNKELCYRYVARVVKNVTIEPSPLWLRHKLTASGIRPINNIVDITNYVMLEMGQPMHAFDIDFVKDRQIIVRNADENEDFQTLDATKRALDTSMLVIADTEKPLAIAGIMGGENSKITGKASAVLLESACFNGTNIRLSSKKLGLRTESSSKFEKGIDPNLALEAVNRAAQLIEELECGEIVKGYVDCYVNERKPWSVPYSPERINRLIGTSLTDQQIVDYLKKLDIDAKDNVAYIKTYRADLQEEADLAEEVARLYGFNNIKTTLASGTPTVGKKTTNQNILDIIKDTMVACGLCEIMNYSFESPKVFEKLFFDKNSDLRQAIKVLNPLGEDFSVMRTTTLNGILQSLSNNYNRRNESAELFEISTIYLPKHIENELPEEMSILTLGMYGKVDFYNLKGVIETLFESLGIINFDFSPLKTLNYMHPGRTAVININGQSLGYLGEVHPIVCENYNIETTVYIGVIDVTAIYSMANLNRTFKALAKYPDVKRDIAIIVKDEILVKEIEQIIIKNGKGLIESINLFDVYKGQQVGEGLKSVAYNIVFRANDRTLKDTEVSEINDNIVKELKEKLGASLR